MTWHSPIGCGNDHLNRLDEPIFMAVSKPLLTEFGIHQRLESCVLVNCNEKEGKGITPWERKLETTLQSIMNAKLSLHGF